MLKIFLGTMVFAGFLFAALTNAIALTVNNSPITLYDIDEVMTNRNLSHNQAVGVLVDKVLYENELKKKNIKVSNEEILSYIGKIAQANGMNIMSFKQAMVKQKQNYQAFVDSIKNRIATQKLVAKIAKGKLELATDKEIEEYYNNNKDQFQNISLNQAKEKIFNILMSQKEQIFLKEYFETLKITADIKILR